MSARRRRPTIRSRSSSCSRPRRSSSSAARVASARRRSPRRPRSARRAGSAARCSCSRSTRPRRLATALGLDGVGNVARRVAARGAEGRGRRAARRAVGRDARHEAELGRARAAPRARRGDRVPHPREPAVPQPHRALRAEPRLHRDGAALRDPPERRVRPHHHRHAADAERDRLPRRARAHGRLLRRPAAALAHAAVPRRRQARQPRASTSRAGPSTKWPTASSAASSSQDIAEFFLNFQSMYDGFVTRAKAVERLLHDRRTTFAVVTTLEAAPLHEAERFCDAARRPASSTSARSCSTGRCPTRCSRPDGAAAAARVHRRRRPLADELASTTGDDPRSPIATARPRVLRTVGESFHNFSLVAKREAELRAELDRVARRRRARPDRSTTRSPTSTGSTRSARYLFGGAADVTHARRPRAEPHRRCRAPSSTTCERLVAALAAARRPLVLRPAAARADRRGGGSPVRRARAGAADDRARRSTRRTWSARSSTRSNGRCYARSLAHRRDRRGDTPALGSKERVRVQCIPVRCDDRLIGLVTREESMTSPRRPGELERTYLETFDRFARMIAEGSFPFAVEEVELESAPRVGDGVIVIDEETRVKFASPNAVSSLHRMGIHAYAQAQRLRRGRLRRRRAAQRDARCSLPVTEEIERDDVSVLLRVLPLLEPGQPVGRDRADPRRHRPPAPRPHAPVEGRDDPRDPPPGEEQPADDRVAAAAAGPAACSRPRPGPRSRSRSGASARSRSCTRRCRATRATSCRFNEIVRPLVRARRGDRVRRPSTRSAFTVEGDAGELPGRGRDPARGRAQRADAERGRSRVPGEPAGRGARRGDARAHRRARRDRGRRRRHRSARPSSRSTGRGASGSRSCRRSSRRARTARSRCTTTTARPCACACRSRCPGSSSRVASASG